MKNKTINVKGSEIAVYHKERDDYISLTDIARHRDAERTDYIIQNWLRNRNTIEFLGIWEQLNNPDFKPIEFDGFRKQAGLNSFVLTAKRWIEKTGAIGLVSKAGRYGGTYAHKDIAFEFASWISVEFKLYLIKEFQRLKEDENRRLSLAWKPRTGFVRLALPSCDVRKVSHTPDTFSLTCSVIVFRSKLTRCSQGQIISPSTAVTFAPCRFRFQDTTNKPPSPRFCRTWTRTLPRWSSALTRPARSSRA